MGPSCFLKIPSFHYSSFGGQVKFPYKWYPPQKKFRTPFWVAEKGALGTAWGWEAMSCSSHRSTHYRSWNKSCGKRGETSWHGFYQVFVYHKNIAQTRERLLLYGEEAGWGVWLFISYMYICTNDCVRVSSGSAKERITAITEALDNVPLSSINLYNFFIPCQGQRWRWHWSPSNTLY